MLFYTSTFICHVLVLCFCFHSFFSLTACFIPYFSTPSYNVSKCVQLLHFSHLFLPQKSWKEAWSVLKQQWCCEHHSVGCLRTTNLPFDCFAGFGTLMRFTNEGMSGWKGWKSKHVKMNLLLKIGDFPASHVRGVEQKVCEVADKKAKQVIIRWFFLGGLQNWTMFFCFCIAPKNIWLAQASLMVFP